MSDLGFGVAGVGAIGAVHAANLAKLVPGASLVAIADIDAERRRREGDRLGVPAFATLSDLLSNVRTDAIVICTPRGTHASLITEASAAGKHIFCEKPLAASVGQCDEALAVVASAGVRFQVGFNRRFDSRFQRAHEAIARGEIGSLRLLHIISRDPRPATGYASRLPADLFLETTIHDFDTARLLGGEVAEVYATGLPAEPGRLEGALVLLRFKSGAIAVIDNHLASPTGYDNRVEALGEAGVATVENEPAPETGADDQRPFFVVRYDAAYVAEMTAFVGCICAGTPPPATGADGRAAVAIAEAAMRSLETGRPVRINEGSTK
jgi:myo-inositol 2-dehydrogenase/D-chiro-inositol 1-dehydrogenase